MTRCERTSRIVDRLLDGGALADADAAHLPSCASCTEGARRARVFALELNHAARSLAIEPLPAGLARTSVPLPAPRSSSVLVAGVTALAVLLAGLGVAGVLRTPRPPSGSAATPAPAPVFRSEAGLSERLLTAGYVCHEDVVDPTASPPSMGLLCKPGETDGFAAAIVLHRDVAGNPGWVLAKASPMDKVDATFASKAEAVFDVALRESVLDSAAIESAQTWVASAMDRTQMAGSRAIRVANLELKVERGRDGGYVLTVRAAD
jgi:hypothetical protein